jgi:hypothetical protein
MRMKHVGQLPEIANPLVDGRIGGKHYLVELFKDGSKKYWSKKLINSGCDAFVDTRRKLKGVEGLLYCPICGEFRREIEFIKM